MSDITLMIMATVANHPLATAKDEAFRYKPGDIVQLYVTEDIADWDGSKYLMHNTPTHPRFAYIHVTGIPDNISRNVNRLMENFQVIAQKYRRRRFRVLPSALPVVVRNRLRNEKQLTVDWSTAKSYIRKKLVINVNDSSTDDETTQLQDGDLL